jgi:hypothetical protein
MTGKLAIKKLTASDLTLFEWHFRNQNAGNQKSINLNRGVFIDKLFPALPEVGDGMGGRFSLDLHIFGPGRHGDYNLQRKIIKHGTYKNWRLNGEYIYNPDNSPERFNCLVPGDYALFDFSGELQPTSARLFFVASELEDDAGLYRELDNFSGGKSMVTLSHDDLTGIITIASPPEEHPIHELLLEDLLEDAAYNGLESTRKLNRRRSGTRMSMDTLLQAREKAEKVGREGEELVNALFNYKKDTGSIKGYEWTSNENAVSPFDFEVVDAEHMTVRLDVKSTRGSFGQKLHISIAELYEMAESDYRYDIYRVYELRGGTAKLRVARDLASFATEVLDAFLLLPDGVMADSISLDPNTISFDEEQIIYLPDDEE